MCESSTSPQFHPLALGICVGSAEAYTTVVRSNSSLDFGGEIILPSRSTIVQDYFVQRKEACHIGQLTIKLCTEVLVQSST